MYFKKSFKNLKFCVQYNPYLYLISRPDKVKAGKYVFFIISIIYNTADVLMNPHSDISYNNEHKMFLTLADFTL